MTRRPVVSIVLAAAVLTACSGPTAPPPVVRVDRGLVATSVSASGTLVSITEQNLGFAEGGELAEVFVEVGDRVEPGQVLARLDDRALEQALEQSQAQLDQAESMLDKIENGNQVDGAEATLAQAREIVEATEAQVAATDESNDSAIERAKTQLDYDRSVLADAEETLADDRESCRSMPTLTSGTTSSGPGGSTPTSTHDPLVEDMLDGPAAPAAPTPAAPAATPNPACERVAADETAVRQAEGGVIASEAALESAEQRESVDEASGRLSIENARSNVVTAQNQLDLASTDRPADAAAQAAAVRDAEAAVALARGNLDDTALRAPVAGVVSAINGAVGEFVAPASGTTALAPGSRARLPALADPAGVGGTTTTGEAFLVLNGVDSFQLVVPFEESDAARVQPGQVVDVTVDALPGLTRPGTVLATSPTGDDASGIVSYYSTIVLNESDAALRDGQTAEASVRVQDVDNVLRVPSSVVRTENGASVVDVPGADGGDPVVTPFQPGAVGDEYTEIRTGLRDGQEVLLPQAQVSSVQGGPPQN